MTKVPKKKLNNTMFNKLSENTKNNSEDTKQCNLSSPPLYPPPKPPNEIVLNNISEITTDQTKNDDVLKEIPPYYNLLPGTIPTISPLQVIDNSEISTNVELDTLKLLPPGLIINKYLLLENKLNIILNDIENIKKNFISDTRDDMNIKHNLESLCLILNQTSEICRFNLI